MGLAGKLIPVIVVAALALAGPVHAAPPPPQLIVNGDFEASAITPWTSFGGPSSLADQTWWVAASGKQSIELYGGGAIAQDVPTTAGGRYDLTFAYAGNPGCTQGTKHLTVSWN